MDDTLLTLVKRQLYQTNADPETEAIISDLIEDAKAFLGRYAIDPDYSKATRERALLVEYVRYSLANARDDFPKNYRDEIFALSNTGKVKKHAASERE